MARKSKSRSRLKCDEELGKEFERDAEKWGKRFGGRMEAWGKGFGERMESKAKLHEQSWKSRWHGFFGPLGPLVSTLFGIAVCLLFILAIQFLAFLAKSAFVSDLGQFLLVTLPVFFLAGLVFNYAKYFARCCIGVGKFFMPLVSAAEITFAFWVLSEIIRIAAIHSSLVPSWVSQSISSNLLALFVIIALICYSWLAVKLMSGCCRGENKECCCGEGKGRCC